MSTLQWNSTLSVKVPEIDAEHKRLVDLVNQLGDAMTQGKGSIEVVKVLNGLVEYTVHHFTSEEKLMAKYGYPDLPAHQKEHRDLVAQVTDLQAKVKGGSTTVSIDVMKFLVNWLTQHIQKNDKAVGEFICAKSKKASATVA